MAATTPNVYSTSPLLNVSSTAGESISFGFAARFLRVYNASAVDLFFDALGNVPSTGSGRHIIKTGDKFEADLGVRVRQIGLTTTSTGAGGSLVSVLALGD